MSSLSSPDCCSESHPVYLNSQLSACPSCPTSVSNQTCLIKNTLRKYKFDNFQPQVHDRDFNSGRYMPRNIPPVKSASWPLVKSKEGHFHKCWRKGNYVLTRQFINESTDNALCTNHVNDENRWERVVCNFLGDDHGVSLMSNKNPANEGDEFHSLSFNHSKERIGTGQCSRQSCGCQKNAAFPHYCCRAGFDQKRANIPIANCFLANPQAFLNRFRCAVHADLGRTHDSAYHGYYQANVPEDYHPHPHPHHHYYHHYQFQAEHSKPTRCCKDHMQTVHHASYHRSRFTHKCSGELAIGDRQRHYWCVHDFNRFVNPVTNCKTSVDYHACGWFGHGNVDRSNACGCHMHCSNFVCRSSTKRDFCCKGCCNRQFVCRPAALKFHVCKCYPPSRFVAYHNNSGKLCCAQQCPYRGHYHLPQTTNEEMHSSSSSPPCRRHSAAHGFLLTGESCRRNSRGRQVHGSCWRRCSTREVGTQTLNKVGQRRAAKFALVRPNRKRGRLARREIRLRVRCVNRFWKRIRLLGHFACRIRFEQPLRAVQCDRTLKSSGDFSESLNSSESNRPPPTTYTGSYKQQQKSQRQHHYQHQQQPQQRQQHQHHQQQQLFQLHQQPNATNCTYDEMKLIDPFRLNAFFKEKISRCLVPDHNHHHHHHHQQQHHRHHHHSHDHHHNHHHLHHHHLRCDDRAAAAASHRKDFWSDYNPINSRTHRVNLGCIDAAEVASDRELESVDDTTEDVEKKGMMKKKKKYTTTTTTTTAAAATTGGERVTVAGERWYRGEMPENESSSAFRSGQEADVVGRFRMFQVPTAEEEEGAGEGSAGEVQPSDGCKSETLLLARSRCTGGTADGTNCVARLDFLAEHECRSLEEMSQESTYEDGTWKEIFSGSVEGEMTSGN